MENLELQEMQQFNGGRRASPAGLLTWPTDDYEIGPAANAPLCAVWIKTWRP